MVGKERRVGLFKRLKQLLHCNRLGDLLVANGALSSGDLQYALAQQRVGRARLGRVLIDEQIVSRQTIYGALVQQWTLRVTAGLITCIISVSSVGVRSAKAATVIDVPSEISLVQTANAAFQKVNYYPSLFGTEERSSTNITPFTKWTSMFNHFERDIHQSAYQSELHDWQHALQPLVGLPMREQAERVNAMMNAQPYVEDQDNYGVADYWADPLEFLAKGGDCEDYAIAKYASLRMLGVPEDRMRVAIVKDLQKGVPHAILILYTDNGEALLLDNQAATVKSSTMVARYQPIFSINQHAWWLHKAPTTTEMADAE